MKVTNCFVTLTIILLFAGFNSARAQTAASASLAGRVADERGAILAGAKIMLRSLDTGQTRETRSDAAGAYLFPALPPGWYEALAEAAGFAPVRHSLVALAVGQAAFTTPATATTAWAAWDRRATRSPASPDGICGCATRGWSST